MSFLLANEKYFIKETSVETAFLCSAPQFLSSILFTVAQFISRDSDRFLKRGGTTVCMLGTSIISFLLQI